MKVLEFVIVWSLMCLHVVFVITCSLLFLVHQYKNCNCKKKALIPNILKSTSNYGFLSELIYAIFNFKTKLVYDSVDIRKLQRIKMNDINIAYLFFSFSFQSLNFIKWGYIDEVIFYLLLFTNFIILICLAKNQNAMYSSMDVYEHILDLMILNNFYSYVYTYYFQFQYINILNSF
jgi:hypothetical protein